MKKCLGRIFLVFGGIVVTILFLPVILLSVTYEMIRGRMKRKCKPLIKQGFSYHKLRKNKKTIYFLRRDDLVIRICLYDDYQISVDQGVTFMPVLESAFFSLEEKKAFEDNMHQYKTCDYRDREAYDPTNKLVLMLSRHLHLALP